jgi:hypothetical protein
VILDRCLPSGLPCRTGGVTLTRRGAAGAVVQSFDRTAAAFFCTGSLRRAEDIGGKRGGKTAGAASETAAFVEFIEVVPCGIAPMSVGELSAETVFEMKCLFAIDAIAAVYRADLARGGR